MPNTLLTVVNVREEVRRTLGVSGVQVELSDDDILLVLRQALRKVNLHRPGRGVVKLQVSAGVKRYQLSPLPAGLKGVRRVSFLEEPTSSSPIDPFDPRTYMPAPTTLVGRLTPGDFAQEHYYREESRRVMSLDPVSRWQWEGDNFYIYIDVPAGPAYMVSVEYVFHYVDQVGVVNGMDKIPDVDADWVLALCVARAKQILGRVRGKFGGIADDQGSVTEVDGSTLITEGKEEEAELLTAIKARRRPLLPVVAP